ncbi:amidophosphoribosyltransferase [Aspergillus saccharolyticus JOP 1030-1]|uniref:N-terminal nucleophile aminohydrolase n=1 Tax=Aspergillus saccharolyticus JOP 1030-1 TaxID=1450539 RepID=A0A318YZN7_9EURO|nr:N-terminal nucleophile aminohydrolase [Aspergillus saccharolyticus JOP 1030-1]PYH40176.1 N-terminal nucleophile aminohydrolase [Aspergillus saccharolyticus JOP 1030-1]
MCERIRLQSHPYVEGGCDTLFLPMGVSAESRKQGLYQLQHRGQDACGIATTEFLGPYHCIKGKGLVSEVFDSNLIGTNLIGYMGLGHVRYRTSGTIRDLEAQPISSHGTHDIFLVHNGHVSESAGKREFQHQRSDSYIILSSKIFLALHQVYLKCSGSFSCLIMFNAKFVVGFRDSHGIKPLILGQRRNHDSSHDYMLASKTVALEKLDYVPMRDISPREAVLIDVTANNQLEFHQVVNLKSYLLDIFELVYFARPESTLDGINVKDCRRRIGCALGSMVLETLGAVTCGKIDVVIPVPDSGYKRLKTVWRKLSTVSSGFQAKNVLIVDDSIVRGGTSREIVRIVRKAGVIQVVFASSSPAIRYNHIHGIDLAEPEALIAHGRTESEVAQTIGADKVVYLPLDMLLACCLASRAQLSKVYGFEVGFF